MCRCDVDEVKSGDTLLNGRFAFGAMTVLLGLCVGFFSIYLGVADLGERSPTTVQTVELRAETAWVATLGPGWGATTLAGTELSGRTASLTIPRDISVLGDLVLDISFAKSEPLPPSGLRLGVSVNGTHAGEVHVRGGTVGRLLVASESLRGAAHATIVFTAARPPRGVVVEALALQNMNELSDFLGYVDSCSKGVVSGWARSGTAPSPVTVRRSDASLVTVLPSIERQDLARAGHPSNAGFAIPLTKPAASAERIDVLFPNGRQLNGSPCRVK